MIWDVQKRPDALRMKVSPQTLDLSPWSVEPWRTVSIYCTTQLDHACCFNTYTKSSSGLLKIKFSLHFNFNSSISQIINVAWWIEWSQMNHPSKLKPIIFSRCDRQESLRWDHWDEILERTSPNDFWVFFFCLRIMR